MAGADALDAVKEKGGFPSNEHENTSARWFRSSARCWTSASTDGQLPELLNAIDDCKAATASIVAEVAQHVGDDVVRCIAMSRHRRHGARGMDAVDTGGAHHGAGGR